MLDALLSAAHPLLAPAFLAWGSPVTWLEIAAFAIALAMVLANMRVHPVAWPLAISMLLQAAVGIPQFLLGGSVGLPSLGEPEWMSERPIRGVEPIALPPGFTLRSMADEDEVEARRAVLGLSFGHADPAEWVTPETYRELQRAPDYRKELDLYVAAPDGAFSACCVAWYDPVNRVGTFEPVGTHPAYRRMGLGRAVITEGIDRLAALGELLRDPLVAPARLVLLPLRLESFDPQELDLLCEGGDLVWVGSGGRDPQRARVRFFFRGEGDLFLSPEPDRSGLSRAAEDAHQLLSSEGACFFADLEEGTGLAASELGQALVELVMAGLVILQVPAGRTSFALAPMAAGQWCQEEGYVV